MRRKKIETDEEFYQELDRIGNSGKNDGDKMSDLLDVLQITDEEIEEVRQAIIESYEEDGTPESLKIANDFRAMKLYEEEFR